MAEALTMTIQLTWTRCPWYPADQAEGLDGMTYYVDHGYPTTTCRGAYYAALRRGLLKGTVRSLGEFPYTPQGLLAARVACDTDYMERLRTEKGAGVE